MKIEATLHCVSINETRVIDVTHLFRDCEPEAVQFIWTEGNYSCDCNRQLVFVWSKGIIVDDVACGDTEYDLVELTIDGESIL